jgi:hypothetical protein
MHLLRYVVLALVVKSGQKPVDYPSAGVLVTHRAGYEAAAILGLSRHIGSLRVLVPGFTLAQTKASREAADLSGIAARRIRPDRVSKYLAPVRRSFAWLVPRSTTATAPAIRIFPDFTGSKKVLSARNGISAGSTSTTPSSGSRSGSTIDRRSFCVSNQAVL